MITNEFKDTSTEGIVSFFEWLCFSRALHSSLCVGRLRRIYTLIMNVDFTLNDSLSFLINYVFLFFFFPGHEKP